MTTQEKETIKAHLEEYLREKAINTQKPFRCLNPQHADNHPSMSLDRKRGRVHCFACGADYDLIDLVAIDYGLDTASAFKKAAELYGTATSGRGNTHTYRGTRQSAKKQGEMTAASAEDDTSAEKDTYTYEYTHTQTHANDDYLALCASRLEQTDYHIKRGISTQTARRYGLGYDPAYPVADGTWAALIIPNGSGGFIARNTDFSADKADRIRKSGNSSLFNAKQAFESKKPIFVVEGEIDALSVIEAGGNALALGSTANWQHLVAFVKTAGAPDAPILLALDNDPAGRKASEALADALTAFTERVYECGICNDTKDPNQALTDTRTAFIEAVAAAERIEGKVIEERLRQYRKNSAGAYIDSFLGNIASSADTPCLPTGFDMLDVCLDGGLYEGLYIIGGISSLGKTSYVLQMCDQIARSGIDVLIFSLEMARTELMAKSISRLTVIGCLESKLDTKHAKSARGITTGRRYGAYSKLERKIIEESVESYRIFASRIFISEGAGDIGTEQVRAQVRRHIELTGRVPVVVVDYLQILAPYSERATDKQNTDRSVMELKRISRDYKLPLIAISSFNRQSYREAVTMESFKESGAIEYSSDVLLGLQLAKAGMKDADLEKEKRNDPRDVQIRVLKNRNGPTGGIVNMAYYPVFGYFKEVLKGL